MGMGSVVAASLVENVLIGRTARLGDRRRGHRRSVRVGFGDGSDRKVMGFCGLVWRKTVVEGLREI